MLVKGLICPKPNMQGLIDQIKSQRTKLTLSLKFKHDICKNTKKIFKKQINK